jgi:hypothetical protein
MLYFGYSKQTKHYKMSEDLRLIIPEKAEAVFFVVLGLITMIVLNIQRLLLLMGDVSVTEVKNAFAFDTRIANALVGFESGLDPRFVDIAVWMLVGLATFIGISFFIGWWHSFRQEVSVVEYYRHPKSFHAGHEVNAFLARGAVRAFGVIGLILWLFLFFADIVSGLSVLFIGALTNISEPSSWLWLVLCPVFCAVGLYVFAILLRMITLRSRVFG